MNKRLRLDVNIRLEFRFALQEPMGSVVRSLVAHSKNLRFDSDAWWLMQKLTFRLWKMTKTPIDQCLRTNYAQVGWLLGQSFMGPRWLGRQFSHLAFLGFHSIIVFTHVSTIELLYIFQTFLLSTKANRLLIQKTLVCMCARSACRGKSEFMSLTGVT